MRFWCGKLDDGRPFVRIIGEKGDEHDRHRQFRSRLGEGLNVVPYHNQDGVDIGTEIHVVGNPIKTDAEDAFVLPDDQAELETIAAERGIVVAIDDKPQQIKTKLAAQTKAKKRKRQEV